MRLRHVTIDCADAYALVSFWSKVTGWPVSDERSRDDEVDRLLGLGATVYEDHRTTDGMG